MEALNVDLHVTVTLQFFQVNLGKVAKSGCHSLKLDYFKRFPRFE